MQRELWCCNQIIKFSSHFLQVKYDFHANEIDFRVKPEAFFCCCYRLRLCAYNMHSYVVTLIARRIFFVTLSRFHDKLFFVLAYYCVVNAVADGVKMLWGEKKKWRNEFKVKRTYFQIFFNFVKMKIVLSI